MSWKENSFFFSGTSRCFSVYIVLWIPSPRMHPSLTHPLTKPLNPSCSPAASVFSLHTCYLPSVLLC